ncbi:MAG: CHASE3 domain-containing protein [Burkholderiales bacterium]|nr:CHASE3 domain-containing protein [Flavobacterium sp.]
MNKIRHFRIKLIFIFGTVLILSLSVFSYIRINNLMKVSALVNHTNVVKLDLETMFSELKDAESAHRGYLLTYNKDFLDQFNHALINVELQLNRLDFDTRENYSQQRNIELLKLFTYKRIKYMQSLLVIAETTKISTEKLLKGRVLMNTLRKQVTKIMNEEDFLLRVNTKSLTKESLLTPLFTIFLIICSILVLTVSYYGINRELKVSNVLKSDLESSKKDLLEANTSLQKSNQEIALSLYNKRFLAEFSEKFSNYKVQNEFFNSLVQYIADITHLDYVLVGKLEHFPQQDSVVHTMSVAAFGKLIDNFTYALPDGPCEQVTMGAIYSYPTNCQISFPKNQTLKDLNVAGYVGYPLIDSEAKAIGIIAVMHKKNIEDPETLSSVLKIVAKRTEMELERIKNEEILEKKNISLEEKNETLAKMNKELESFTYISSHDLQEPLRKIQTFITRIIDIDADKLSDNGKNYLIRTQESANKMQNLIRDLLAYSRLNIEIFPKENTDLNLLLGEILDDLDEDIKDKKAIIKLNGHDEAKIIVTQFRQLLTNLISNSMKFSKPETPIIITIENEIIEGKEVPFENKDPDLNYNKITVTDNGIGFESEYKNRIFEVFQRLHVTKEYPGTGIGLAIVKKIVENHQGFIAAEGQINRGATFTIYLPT